MNTQVEMLEKIRKASTLIFEIENNFTNISWQNSACFSARCKLGELYNLARDKDWMKNFKELKK